MSSAIEVGIYGTYVPNGGITGQYLAKLSNDDGDIGWTTQLKYTSAIFAIEGDVVSGDCVKLLSTDKVQASGNNTDDEPAIGVVIAKPTVSTAEVLIAGLCLLTITGIEANKLVFLGDDGAPTTTKPSSGWLQCLGWCYKDTKMIVNFNPARIKQNPF